MVAADVLTEAGLVVWEAGDAQEALGALEQHPSIGLLFTDINMPGPLNGLDLARQVSTAKPDVELIVTSGAVTLTAVDLPDHGTFLPKPYPAQTLINMVAEKLGARSRRTRPPRF
jgi:DNA-binding NtrC family response regulator